MARVARPKATKEPKQAAKPSKAPKEARGAAPPAVDVGSAEVLDDVEIAADMAAALAGNDEADAALDVTGADADVEDDVEADGGGEDDATAAIEITLPVKTAKKAAKGAAAAAAGKGGKAKVEKTPQQIEDAAARALVRELEKAKLYAPRRTDGPAAIGFPTIKRPVEAWSAPPGGSCKLTMLVRSVGGAGKGVRIELGGAAIDAGLVEPTKVLVAGKTATFAKTAPAAGAGAGSAGGAATWRAEIADVAYDAGIAHPFEPKPPSPEAMVVANELISKTHLEVQVEAKVPASAKSGAMGLLAVAISALPGKTAPMKWTRPFTVG